MFAVCLLSSASPAVVGGFTQPKALTAPDARTADLPAFLRQNRPERLDPFRQSPLQINPPTFRWPAVNGAASYRLEFAREPGFANGRREVVGDSYFRPLEPLEPGLWYWRCRAETPQPGAWIGTESFELAAVLPRWAMRDGAELVRQVPATHPRLYVRQADLAELRANAQRLAAELAPWQRRIRAALEKEFSLASYQPPPQNRILAVTERNSVREDVDRACR